MANRFDLEENIMQCWTVVEDLGFYIDNSKTWSEDERNNYLAGLKIKYDKKFEHMFGVFEECIRQEWTIDNSKYGNTTSKPNPAVLEELYDGEL